MAPAGSETCVDYGYKRKDVPLPPVACTNVNSQEGSAPEPTSTALPQQIFVEEAPVPRCYSSRNKCPLSRFESS